MSRQCPRCSLFSPPGAVRCDCGHDFQTGKMEPSFVMADVIQKAGGAAKLLEQTGRSNMRTGAILFWLGAGFTVLTYLAGSIRPESQGGGGFFLFWGALVFGALQFLRGVDQRRKGRRLAEHAKRPGSGSAWTIDGVRFDTTGWQLQDASAATMIWTDPDGDVLSLSHVRGQADVPSGDDLPTLRARCRQLAAANNGGLVYADFVNGDGVRAVSLIYKREQLPAYAYTGMVIIPREGHHFLVTVASIERGTTGMRDAIVTARLVQQGKLDPTKTDENRRIAGWFNDPYDVKYSATALNSVADGEQYDSIVPSHPLSKVRGTLRTIEKSIAFQP